MSRFRVSPNSYCRDAPLASMPVAMSRVSWRPKLDLPSDPSRSRRVLKPRKSRLLSVISNFACCCASPTCPPTLDCCDGSCGWIVNADVIFLLHALDQLFDQFVERAVHLHLLQLLAHFLVEQIAVQQRLLDGAAQIVERLLAVAACRRYM